MPDDPQTLFKKKSRSFALAARLFSAETRADIVRLYQFCRYVDDLADESQDGEPERLNQLARSLQVGASGGEDPILNDFLRLATSRQLPLEAAKALVAASEADCGARSIQTEAELIQFAYGVAGTVGRLMQALLGADDARAAPFAVDLGIALQLTNIARDVAEDAERDRFYLPASFVAPGDVRLALSTRDPTASQKVDAAVEHVLSLADRYYQSALAGHCFIPRRNRRAIFFALSFYRAIGTKLRNRGTGAWRTRTRLGLLEKLHVGLAAYPNYLAMDRRVWSQDAIPAHEAALHEPLGEEQV